jgi:hypothetical protein
MAKDKFTTSPPQLCSPVWIIHKLPHGLRQGFRILGWH